MIEDKRRTKENKNNKTPKKKKIRNVRNKSRFGYLFTLPWIIGFLAFVSIPMVQSFFYSLNSIRLRPTGRIYRFVGFDNYRDIFLKDMNFVQELLKFTLSTILRVPVIVVFALIIAILLNRKIRFKGTFRMIFFLPVIVVSGPVMDQLVQQGATSVPMLDQAAIANVVTSFLPNWMATPVVDLFGQIILVLWYSGVQILIFLAALQKVDKNLYEAAKIDGGSAWECFWKITLPSIKPMILLNAVYTLVTLANSGQNNIINWIYSNMFNATRGYGFASAMAWMYGIVVTLFSIVIFLLFKDRPDQVKKRTHKKKLGKRNISFIHRKTKLDKDVGKGVVEDANS